MKMNKISKFEFRRAVFHVLLGIAIIILALIFPHRVQWILFGILVVGIIISITSLKIKMPFIYRMIVLFEKPVYIEIFPGKGILFFIAGSLLALKLFSQQPGTALAAIAILTFGDSVSHIIGLAVGKIKHKRPFSEFKNIEGTIAGIIVSFAAASFFVKPIYALIGAVIAMLAEAFTIRMGGDNVDDNLIIPLVAGTVIYLLTNYGII